jgi:hypothetical protein
VYEFAAQQFERAMRGDRAYEASQFKSYFGSVPLASSGGTDAITNKGEPATPLTLPMSALGGKPSFNQRYLGAF